MGKTSYYSVGGRLLGESTSGAETTYMTDALGSTIGTVTTAGLRNRYTYSPYGGKVNKTGSDPDPKFTWNSRWGYRTTGRDYSEEYAQRRHVSTTTTQWTTADPLWPVESAYTYVGALPTSAVDPAGTNKMQQFIDCMALKRRLYGDQITVAKMCYACNQQVCSNIRCDGDWVNSLAPSTPTPPSGLPKIPKVAKDCFKKCFGKPREEMAKCILKECGGDWVKEKGTGWVYCQMFPEVCERWHGDPCEDVKDTDQCQACADEKEWQCWMTHPPYAWAECDDAHTAAYLKCATDDFGGDGK